MTAMQEKPLSGAVRSIHTRDKTELDSVAERLKVRCNELDELSKRYKKELESGEMPENIRSQFGDLSGKVETLTNQVLELAQRNTQDVLDGKSDPDRVGSLLTRNKEILDQAQAIKKARGKMSIEGISVRNIITMDGIGDGAYLANAQLNLRPDVLLELVNMINWIPVAGDSIPLVRESAYSIMAGIVPEGDTAAPESTLTFGKVTVLIDVVSHYVRVSKQLLDDMPSLGAYIEGRLAYGVRLKLEHLVINGATNSFSGLLHTGNSLPSTAGANAVDTINKSKYKAWASRLKSECVILNPEDWGDIERLKGDDGHYIFGNPSAMVQPVLWGMPVVLSAAMPLGKHWVGNLTLGVNGFVRQDVSVALSTEDGDNFKENLVTILAEMRAGFGVAVPDACVSGNLV